MKRKKQKEPAGMNVVKIFAALDLLEKQRHIPQSFMLDKIIQAITTAYKRDHPEVENVIVDADLESRTLRMYVQKTVVSDENFTSPENQIRWEDARIISARYNIGDTVNIPVSNTEFGRIAAGNGKQVIIQGLREAERGQVYDEFNSKQNELLTGTVTRIDPRNSSITLRIGAGSDATDALLMASEQIPTENLEEGRVIKVYVVEVRRAPKGPQVLVSRTHPGLVRRLFELEVPEIYDGLVEVKSVAREAGSRTKLAVLSSDEKIDPIGACIGPKGLRVNTIVEELGGEKIDIIKWSDNPSEYVAAALAPAEVLEVQVADEGKACRCVVPDDQLSLAIGKEGQNARLAARLTGYKIDIKPQSYQGDSPENTEDTLKNDSDRENVTDQPLQDADAIDAVEVKDDTEDRAAYNAEDSTKNNADDAEVAGISAKTESEILKDELAEEEIPEETETENSAVCIPGSAELLSERSEETEEERDIREETET